MDRTRRESQIQEENSSWVEMHGLEDNTILDTRSIHFLPSVSIFLADNDKIFTETNMGHEPDFNLSNQQTF